MPAKGEECECDVRVQNQIPVFLIKGCLAGLSNLKRKALYLPEMKTWDTHYELWAQSGVGLGGGKGWEDVL